MWSIVLLSTFALVFASLPLLVSRRHSLLNPATYVWLMVLGSVFSKSWYIWLLHPQPIDGRDKIFKGAASADFFVPGAVLVCVALAAYAAGFLATPAKRFDIPDWLNTVRISSCWAYGLLFGLTLLSVLAFAVYLHLTDISLLEPPFSDKRFHYRKMGAETRFHFLPYYFFKLAMTSGSVAFAAALLLFHATGRAQTRLYRIAFAVSFSFTLVLAHFASLRLLTLVLVLAVLLLAFKSRSRGNFAFVGVVTAMTLASFVLITFVHRVPPSDGVIVAFEPVEPEQDTPVAELREGEPKELDDATRSSTPEISEETSAPGEEDSESVPPVATAPSSSDMPETEGQNSVASSPSEPVQTTEATARGESLERLEDAGLVKLTRRQRSFGEKVFGGRYFFDFTKLAHLAHHFPERNGYQLGATFFGGQIDAGDGAVYSPNRYIAEAIYHEVRNNVPPGFAGELYLNFGWTGVVLGFLFLGALHRVIFSGLRHQDLPLALEGGLIIIIPASTLVLINSGLSPAISRCVIDIGVLVLICSPGLLLKPFQASGLARFSVRK